MRRLLIEIQLIECGWLMACSIVGSWWVFQCKRGFECGYLVCYMGGNTRRIGEWTTHITSKTYKTERIAWLRSLLLGLLREQWRNCSHPLNASKTYFSTCFLFSICFIYYLCTFVVIHVPYFPRLIVVFFVFYLAKTFIKLLLVEIF